MAPRDHYLPGVPCWIDIARTDPLAACDFYAGLFGWSVELADGGPYRIASLGGLAVAGIAAGPVDDDPIGEWLSYVSVDDADRVADAVVAAGGAVLAGPDDVGEAGRVARVTDPDGARFGLWQPGRRPGAELVNAPGTWNLSDLRTVEPSTAESFYSAVFGWRTRTFGSDEQSWTMWCLDGYGDDLERMEPGLRRRQQDEGAPPGFEDVVAGMVTVDPPNGAARSTWTVTFSVGDADRAVARAVELGAAVSVEPFDAGPVRMAELVDPAGAGFAVGHYDPGRG